MKVADAKRRLAAAAAKFGGTVEDDSGEREVVLQVCAPAGKVWAESYGQHIVVATARGPQSWLDDAVATALREIESGVIDDEEDV